LSHYKSNLRDIEFNLFEVLRRQDVLGKPPIRNWTPRRSARCSPR